MLEAYPEPVEGYPSTGSGYGGLRHFFYRLVALPVAEAQALGSPLAVLPGWMCCRFVKLFVGIFSRFLFQTNKLSQSIASNLRPIGSTPVMPIWAGVFAGFYVLGERFMSQTSSPATSQEHTTPATPVRLDFIDSLRALAALAVVVLHAYQIYGFDLTYVAGFGMQEGLVTSHLYTTDIGTLITTSYSLTRFGHYAVEIFIVISGFSLMIPVARRAEARLTRGLKDFFWRRARRILPPYYAAVVLALLLTFLVPGMNIERGIYWDLAIPAFTLGSILSHIFLVHNISTDWLLSINPPLWSIAVEWQIYFLFPLLLVIWRRIGTLATLIALTIVSAVQIGWGWFTYPLSDSWFLLLFTLGMLGAGIAFSPRPFETRLRERVPWGWAAIGSFVLFGALTVFAAIIDIGYNLNWVKDSILGLTIACLLIMLTRQNTQRADRPSLVLRVLNWRPLVHVGHFSYSIYLVHAPALAAVALLLMGTSLPLEVLNLFMILLCVPLALVVAYPFYLLFERPFLSNAARRATQPVHRVANQKAISTD
jgi:peptidoglycan/LPS O-acetylase OafA/YrhL